MLGVGVAYIQYRFFEHRPLISLQDVSVPLYTFVFTILAGILFSRNIARNRLNRQLEGQLSTIRTVCASIAHELRTPLLAIKSGAAGIKHFLPRLLETYKIAQEHNLKIPEIREGHLNSMTQVMNNIDSEVDFSNDVITSLLTNAMHNNVSLNPKLRYDIASTVKAALLRYHFNPASQIEVVHFDESNNFEYHADEILVTHIIFNLLKNAIYAIEEMRKGEIFITLAHEKNYNCLYFRDTAKGMSKETQSNLFQAFYTEKPNNTGIGLAFSKMVMDNLGGEIAVNSVLGEYAEFVLHFPIVKDSAKG
jgi:signal transduction histidine kinase